MTHELKCWPAEFEAIWRGEKHHEVRRMDRAFRVDDVLTLREWDPRRDVNDRYTGRWLSVRITYVSAPGSFGLPDDICVLSLHSPGNAPERHRTAASGGGQS